MKSPGLTKEIVRAAIKASALAHKLGMGFEMNFKTRQELAPTSDPKTGMLLERFQFTVHTSFNATDIKVTLSEATEIALRERLERPFKRTKDAPQFAATVNNCAGYQYYALPDIAKNLGIKTLDDMSEKEVMILIKKVRRATYTELRGV